MNDLEILIKPTLDSTRESMGYEEYDDYNLDDVLFQQGYDMDVKVVSPGERFTVNKNFLGQIKIYELDYRLNLKGFGNQDDLDDDLDVIELKPGEYHFHDDGISLVRIK